MNMRFNPASGDRSLALRLAMVSASSVSVQRDQPYVVKGWFLAGQISMIVGPSNVGKSFLALDIAHHIARGKDWHGRRVKGAEVLYIAAEGGRTFQNRVAALNQAAERAGEDLSELRLWLLASPVTLTGAESDAAALVEAVKAVQRDCGGRDFRLIVVDTMSRAMGAADENAAKDINDLICNLETLRDATGAHILLVHHSGKDASKGARGHSSLRAAVDTEIIISRDSETDLIAAKIDKQRDGLTGATFRYRLLVEDLGEDADGDRVTSCTVMHVKDGI
ncbi:AAA family ATPase [Paracoccus liaowanqingii]|uniref:AAA family ATPase n=1 Tax=Paracoccus liaowanqingii TaxID=2560053 RepID=A0A4Z1BXU1_9RHOB|nr:helicase RepA family protein [Paracoccus liaowanqingii]TGN54894.1 AAA family ATPase [Paracoccus liaowanqingii]